jgi:hypothetical protein
MLELGLRSWLIKGKTISIKKREKVTDGTLFCLICSLVRSVDTKTNFIYEIEKQSLIPTYLAHGLP